LCCYAEAVEAYEQASQQNIDYIKLYIKFIVAKPEYPRAYYNQGIIYSRIGKSKKAIEAFSQACERTYYKDHIYITSLSAAYAETGDFEKAVEYQKKAIDLADDSAKKEYEKRLEAYKANKPWRE
jgi:tetratricopeptide (TPR) repeat protein